MDANPRPVCISHSDALALRENVADARLEAHLTSSSADVFQGSIMERYTQAGDLRPSSMKRFVPGVFLG